jgi:hypothetical protein
MPNGRKRAERARKERAALLTSDLLHHPPMAPLTLDQLRSVRFTHLRIHPTFANVSNMTVFEVYFAVKYGLMALSRLPPIRVFAHEGHLWSVDNRRLWVMRQMNDWRIEGPFTERQSAVRFREFIMKNRGLNGTSGEEVTFHRDAPHECCVDAWNSESLDEHLAVVHLKTTLDEIKLLSKCVLHHQNDEHCCCVGNDEPDCRTLSIMIHARRQRLDQTIQQSITEITDDR